LLRDFHLHFQKGTASLYEAEFAHDLLTGSHRSWQVIVQAAVRHQIPMLSISNALTHFEASRRGRSSANFIQGLRDRFGAHGYKRLDAEGDFHSDWTS
jgi:6-phosphogluconate dehydrogenase